MVKLDLSWGNPYFLLEILSHTYQPKTFEKPNIKTLIYEEDLGNRFLIDYCKKITLDVTDIHYKYILITNGATQAINTIFRSWNKLYSKNTVVTNKLGYPFYSRMISKSNLERKEVNIKKHITKSNEITLIDSPSNPLGLQYSTTPDAKTYLGCGTTLFDAAYHNRIYNANLFEKPPHDVFVGTFSKLLGIAGARVGWLATNNKKEFDSFVADSLYENATVSKVSQSLVKDILDTIDINNFMNMGRMSLDNNRHILQHIAPLLGTDVQEKGMFYCAQADERIFDIFYKANIHFVQFENDGDRFIRLNLGQTSDILIEAIKRIGKADRRK